MSPTECAYAAGLFDGEGCVGITRATTRGRVYHQLRLTIGNTDPRMLAWLREKTGTGSIATKFRSSPKHKPAWDWVIVDARAEAFLVAVYPYLVIKRERADVALAFRRLIRPHGHGRWSQQLSPADVDARDQKRAHLKLLNRKGVAC